MILRVLFAITLGTWIAMLCAFDVLNRRRIPIAFTVIGAAIVLAGALLGAWAWSWIAAVLAFAAVGFAGLGWGDRWAALVLGGLLDPVGAGAALALVLGPLLVIHLLASPAAWESVRRWPALPFLIAAGLAVSLVRG